MPRSTTSERHQQRPLLFVPHRQPGHDADCGELRRRARRHVMHNFLAHPGPQLAVGRPKQTAPSANMHRFRLTPAHEWSDCAPISRNPPDSQHMLIPRPLGGFDPFSSLATDEPADTLRILRTVCEPCSTTKHFLSWVHAWFNRIRTQFWSFAMSDAAFYHILGFQAAVLAQDGEYYFHKVRALRHFRQSLDCVLRPDNDDIISPPATTMATTLLLFQATRQNEIDEARSHMAALERMANNATLYQLGPAGWFCVNSVVLNYASSQCCRPPLPYYVHPACRLPHDLDTTILAASWRRADDVVSLFPELNLKVLDSAMLRDIFQLFFVMHALTKDMDRYEEVYGLNYDLKYRIMSIMAAVAEQTPLDLPYLLLVALHCWIFMFGQNQMHERNDDGIHSMLDGAREVLRQNAQTAVWHNPRCAKSIVWIMTSITAYSLHTLRQPAEINDDLYPKLSYSLSESGIDDETTLRNFMAMCSGEALWPDEAIALVWRQLGPAWRTIETDNLAV